MAEPSRKVVYWEPRFMVTATLGIAGTDIGVSIYEVASSPQYRWYYHSQMRPEELLIMKTFDSRGVIGNAGPHASFVDRHARADKQPDAASNWVCCATLALNDGIEPRI